MFSSRGLATVGQDEVFVALDVASLSRALMIDDAENNETDDHPLKHLPVFPRDIFRLYTAVLDSASKATFFTELGHIFFPEGLFGNKENCGFIFVRPTLQCFQNIVLPSPPFLIAISIHKWEIPWAKVFPLRLVLRLGYEHKSKFVLEWKQTNSTPIHFLVYPSPVISYLNRKSVYFEIGHTIMNVLAVSLYSILLVCLYFFFVT